MKSIKTVLVALFFASLLFILAGCKKSPDYIFHGQYGAAAKYEIKMVTVKPPFADFTDTICFTYNEYGNPIEGIRSETRTAAPNYFFKYDRFQRMIALVAAYGLTETSIGVETWTKYIYDAKGRIVKDSVWIFPDIVNGQPFKGIHCTITVSLYEYDTNDRISKVTWFREGIEPYVVAYSYDNSGNREGVSYDDKINYHLTNKIWMFLARDYSINNPLVGSYLYNKVGLPVAIDCGKGYADFLEMPFAPITFTKATITYSK
jgi:hypothetical protein